MTINVCVYLCACFCALRPRQAGKHHRRALFLCVRMQSLILLTSPKLLDRILTSTDHPPPFLASDARCTSTAAANLIKEKQGWRERCAAKRKWGNKAVAFNESEMVPCFLQGGLLKSALVKKQKRRNGGVLVS